MGQDDSNLLRDAARQLQHNLNSLLASQDLVTAEDRRKLRLSIDQVQCHLVAPEEKAFEIVNTVSEDPAYVQRHDLSFIRSTCFSLCSS